MNRRQASDIDRSIGTLLDLPGCFKLNAGPSRIEFRCGQGSEFQASQILAVVPRWGCCSQSGELELIDFRFANLQLADFQLIDRELIDGQLVDRQLVDRHLVDCHFVDGQLIDRQLVDRQLVDRHFVDGQPVGPELSDFLRVPFPKLFL